MFVFSVRRIYARIPGWGRTWMLRDGYLFLWLLTSTGLVFLILLNSEIKSNHVHFLQQFWALNAIYLRVLIKIE
jgi:hypothetical protein